MNLYYESNMLAGRPTIVFGSSLGTTTEMWRPQIAALRHGYNCIAFDLPGHGYSPSDYEYQTIEALADGVYQMLRSVSSEAVSFCGLSIGGAIGQVLAAKYPQMINRLILASTGVRLLTPQAWRERAQGVLGEKRMNWVIDIAPARHFTDRFRSENQAAVGRVVDWLEGIVPEDYARACGTLERFDGELWCKEIVCPTLIIAGSKDLAITPSNGKELNDKIRTSTYREIADAAHLCNIERPAVFNRYLEEFLG